MLSRITINAMKGAAIAGLESIEPRNRPHAGIVRSTMLDYL